VHIRLARAAHVQRAGEREHHDYAAQHLEDAVDGLENQLDSHGSGLWANHELPARAEESVYDAQKNGRIETDDRRKSREWCVGDRGGNLNRSDGEPGNQIRAKIFRAIRCDEADVRHRQLPKRAYEHRPSLYNKAGTGHEAIGIIEQFARNSFGAFKKQEQGQADVADSLAHR
jgi:hypothetical protein